MKHDSPEMERCGHGIVPSFILFIYSTKVPRAPLLDVSDAHQYLFLFFFLEVEGLMSRPLTVRWGPRTNPGQWITSRSDVFRSQEKA